MIFFFTNKRTRYFRGFTLVETVVAVGIVVLMITLPIGYYIRAGQQLNKKINELTALYLAQEALELAKMHLSEDEAYSKDTETFVGNVKGIPAWCINPSSNNYQDRARFCSYYDIRSNSKLLKECNSQPLSGRVLSPRYCGIQIAGIEKGILETIPAQINTFSLDPNDLLVKKVTVTGPETVYYTNIVNADTSNEKTIFSRKLSVDLIRTAAPRVYHNNLGGDGDLLPDRNSNFITLYDAVRITASVSWGSGASAHSVTLSTMVYRKIFF